MARNEYFDIVEHGWRGGNISLEGKWFAETMNDAVTWGHRMGHGLDYKFYVVRVEPPDEAVADALRNQSLDGIGSTVYVEVEVLNEYARITQRKSIRAKCG